MSGTPLGPSAVEGSRRQSSTGPPRPGGREGYLLGVLGIAGALVAVGVDTGAAGSAASQDWSPFVLVAGLLLVGLVADEDGLFSWAGHWIARASPNGVVLYLVAMLLVAVVTALLNLDTSVAFLTPVLIYAARSRREEEAPVLYGCLMMSNAASLLLPGSNLTNLIVLGHLHLSGARFFSRMGLAWVAAVAVTTAVVGLVHHRVLRATRGDARTPERPALGLGLPAVLTVTVLVLVLRTPAPYVAAVGLLAAAIRIVSDARGAGRARRADGVKAGKWRARKALEVLGLPVLVGLFGAAVALGSLGRSWSGPANLMDHIGGWGTMFFAAATSIVVNNLPAASLLAARVPSHPFALLVGLDLGPNLFVSGSLAWIVWLRAARSVGARVSIRRAAAIGAAVAPLSIAVAGAMLVATRLH